MCYYTIYVHTYISTIKMHHVAWYHPVLLVSITKRQCVKSKPCFIQRVSKYVGLGAHRRVAIAI